MSQHEPTAYRRLKDLPQAHLLAAGTSLCAGCGGLQAVHQIQDVLGPNTIFVNAAGCMTLLASYPFTPFRGSWLYTAMASAPAGAQGVRDALDLLRAKGRIDPEQDMQVVVLTGDGSAGGMGLSATSGAIDRRLDFIYVCYDNEGYANTGQQTSASTPHAAHTATAGGTLGYTGEKKDLFSIWVAHCPTYVATISGSDPLDLARKVEKAGRLRGPRLLIAHSPCPPGWAIDPADSHRVGQLAIQSGVWPLKEYEDGSVVHTVRPRQRRPVEEYLRAQQRFAHLFEPERNEAVLRELQDRVDRYWSALG
jgi:pyruvate ferredoxin oxidoreductase beta subunit